MSRKTIRTIFIFCIGIIAGIFLYLHFGSDSESSSLGEDSLFVNNLYDNSSIDKINQDINSSRQNSITRAVSILSPAVVGINVTQVREYQRRSPFSTRDPQLREFFPDLFKDYRYQQQISSLGSGFIISSDGYILTNEHVVENATEVIITITNGEKAEAQIVGIDPKSDVALLKIDINSLQYAKLGNSDDVILGEWAIAVGNPFGLFEINNRATVTVGVISALNRDFGEMSGRIYQDMIQTDASINHGNSGGPLCNALGEVIGMNTFIYSDRGEGSVGIGFAIPINRISRLIEDLKTNRKIDRDFWIGIRVKNLDRVIARKMGYNGTDGVVVTYIDRRSPAEKAGMKLGDIVIKLGNTAIALDKHMTEAIYEEDLRVGDTLAIQVWRDGKIVNLNLNLESIRDY
ncbi:MAG: trypsin-like peptidase domain-containing protein [Calditrichia bacterium]|nr:trypsin-like peptidase domain-containing protein [Calditrichia bacterium]